MNKVYRHTYARNTQSLLAFDPDEPIPDFFENSFLKDVTAEYMTCHDITIDLFRKPSERREYAYLCVFNNESWTPVHYGKIVHNRVTFTDVGPGTMFVAGYYVDDKIQPASLPFHVNLNGCVEYVKPSSEELVSLTLSRKYPLLHRFANYSRHLMGAVIEASNFPDFRLSDVLDTVRHDANTQYDSICLSAGKRAYRYYRIRHETRQLQLSELETYVETDTVHCLYSKLFVPELSPSEGNLYNLYNRDITDYVVVDGWLGMDFNYPVRLKKIKYLPRTDSNHVIAGDTYELYMFDGFSFRLLGTQCAVGPSLIFEGVPAGALYLMKDKSRGREHRIFTYENGRIYFW